MEPPAKRPRLAYAPPDPFSLADGDEDEISMDPEEFAVKQDPNYWLDRSRAAADDKLQSAFESLFEKYSKDFGDTGDEINFYTDEIEVDNGHIASLPNADETNIGSLFGGNGGKKAEDGGDTEESDEERILHGSGADREASKALLPEQGVAWLSRRRDHNSPYSIVSPPKLGLPRPSPGYGGSFGSPLAGLGAAGPPGFFSSPVRPAWAVPDIPEEAFSPSKSRLLQASNYRSTSLSPSWKVVRKALPAALTHSAGHASDDDDDLILDSAMPMLATPTKSRLFHCENTARRNSLAKDVEDKSPKRQPSANSQDGQPSKEAPDQTSPSKSNAEGNGAVEKTPKKQRRRVAKNSSAETEADKKETPKEVCVAEATRSPAADRLPTPPEDGPAESILREPGMQNKTPKTVRFARNTIDPSYAFSDEEDGGLRKRVLPPKEAVPKENSVPVVAEKEARQPDTVVIPDSPTPNEPERADEANSHVHTDKRAEEPAPEAPVPTVLTTSPAKIHASPAKLYAPVPRTPQRKGPAPDMVPDSHHSSIVSLVSDESADEDELSLGPGDFTPRGVHRLHAHKPAVRVGRRSFRKAATVKRIKKAEGKAPRLSSTSFSSPLLHGHSLRTAEAFSPVGSPVKTPGGTIRRCGQDGFKCGRDFCFQCL